MNEIVFYQTRTGHNDGDALVTLQQITLGLAVFSTSLSFIINFNLQRKTKCVEMEKGKTVALKMRIKRKVPPK